MNAPVSVSDLLVGRIVHRIREDVRDLNRLKGFEFVRDAVAHVLNSEADRLPSTRKESAS